MVDHDSTTRPNLCGNCQTPLDGPYCHQCGQPVEGLVRPLSGWIADFLDGVVQWDGRIPRTLTPLLLRPGFLTREYLAGRRVRYVTPVRLFLFLVIILFLAVNWFADVGDNMATDAASLAPASEDTARVGRIVAWLPEPQRREVLDDALAPEMPEPILGFHGGVDGAARQPLRLGWLSDELNARLDQALQRMNANVQRANHDPRAFVEQMLAVAPQALIVMLPMFALVLKLFYLFRRRLYMEHLLVALHSHAFIALVLLLIIALDVAAGGAWSWLARGLQWLVLALWLWIPLNLLLTQKRVYGQGWPMTLLKFMLIGLLYLVLLTTVSVFTVLLSLLLW